MNQESTKPIDDSPAKEEMTWLEGQLEVFNARQVGRDDFVPLNLVIRDGDGSIIAGLKALTGWDWLYIQVLWVHDAHRRSGLGNRLLQRAEDEATQRGCIGSCLSSYSFQAPEFYERYGYSAFGQIEGYPAGHTMFFLSVEAASERTGCRQPVIWDESRMKLVEISENCELLEGMPANDLL